MSAELGARIRQLEARQAELQHDKDALPRLRALHQQLTTTEIATVIEQLQQLGDDVGLRDLVAVLVQSATLVERYPEKRSTWIRLAVTWTPAVQQLLNAGLLVLGPEPERPSPVPADPDVAEARVAARRERQACYRARRKAQRDAQP